LKNQIFQNKLLQIHEVFKNALTYRKQTR
jgi:hypothetical protein